MNDDPPELRILIADSYEALSRHLARHLRPLGHRVVTANNGREAITILGEAQFDAVLCDLGRPHQEGLDVLRFCSQLAHPPPLVMMAAIDRFREEVLRQGAADFIEKPVIARDVDAVIRRAVANHPPRGALITSDLD